MTQDLTVLLVGLDNATFEELEGEDGFSVERADGLEEGLARVLTPDAVVIALDGLGRSKRSARSTPMPPMPPWSW